jgi:hypothetical protein
MISKFLYLKKRPLQRSVMVIPRMVQREAAKRARRKIAVVGWYSDDDPDNPQNWSTQKKVFVSSLITLLTFSGEYFPYISKS